MQWRVRTNLFFSNSRQNPTNRRQKNTAKRVQRCVCRNDNELGQAHLVQHEIDPGDTLPIKLAPHRLAPGMINVVKMEIEDMLARNIIRPSEQPLQCTNRSRYQKGWEQSNVHRLQTTKRNNKERLFSPPANWPDSGSSSRSNDFLKPRSGLWIVASPISWECYT